MMEKTEIHCVYNLIILDESGSMESIKKPTIQGFNEIVQTIKGIEKQFSEQKHFINLVTFNGLGINEKLFLQPISTLEFIDENIYRPDASTPLYDAIGFAALKLKNEIANQTSFNVLVTILTDGEENASKEFSADAIRKIIEELKKQNWTFTYIGTQHDVQTAASTISITNVMQFTADEDGMKDMFAKEQKARVRHSFKIQKKEVAEDDYYTDENVS